MCFFITGIHMTKSECTSEWKGRDLTFIARIHMMSQLMCIGRAGRLRLHHIIRPASKSNHNLTISPTHQSTTMVKAILIIVLATAALSTAQLVNVPQRLRTNRKVETIEFPASKNERNLLGNFEPELRGKESFGDSIELSVSMSMSMSMILESDPSASPTAMSTTLMPTAAPTAVVEEEESLWICNFCPVYVCSSCASD